MLLVFLLLASLYRADPAAADVVVVAGNTMLTFESAEAAFTPPLEGSGLSGMLMQGSPFNACSTLDALPSALKEETTLIMLTTRGNCSFEVKVRNAQLAGFSAVIVYASDYLANLVTMAGNSEGVYLHAVFVSREAGETLQKYLGDKNSDICLLPATEKTRWSVEVLLSATVLTSVAAIATWLFTKNRRIRYLCSKFLKHKEPCVLRPCIVNAMPSVTYGIVGIEQKTGGNTCQICLEDYKAKENLRILPCNHRFHSRCVDTWLTAWQASCPICKSDLQCGMSDLEASERTPLLVSKTNLSLVDGCWGARKALSEVQLHSNSRKYFTCVSKERGEESSSWRSGLQNGYTTT